MKSNGSLNRVYRLIWSTVQNAWIAVSELSSGRGKSGRPSALVLMQALLGITALAAAEMASGAGSGAGPGGSAAALPSTALPTQATVAAGQVQISTSLTPGAAAVSAVMNVNQSSNQGIVNWGTFNVGTNSQVNFNLPSANASILNRVISSDPSQVLGSITSNGQVYLSNPNGVYFGRTASVDVGGLVATTGTITDSDYLAGLLNFNRNGSTAAVVNLGALTANPGGYIALLAPEVRNNGVVFAQTGTIALATGEAITLSFDPSTHLATISTTPATIKTFIDNQQAVLAPDGMIVLSAKALNSLVGGVIRNSGNLMADSLSSHGGTIVLEGGSIDLVGGSTLSAQGLTSGGTIWVGGEWQGSGTVQRATSVNVQAGATLNASALQSGNGAGGTVAVYSDVSNPLSRTEMDGVILATGAGSGPAAGAGGSVETSGHQLGVNGQVYTGGGVWLLDPANLTINAGSGITSIVAVSTANTVSYSPTTSAVASSVGNTLINNALNAGDVVSLSADSLTVSAPIAATAGSLYLSATTGPISIAYASAAISLGGASSKLNVNAAGSIAISGNISLSGTASQASFLSGSSIVQSANITTGSGGISITTPGMNFTNEYTLNAVSGPVVILPVNSVFSSSVYLNYSYILGNSLRIGRSSFPAETNQITLYEISVGGDVNIYGGAVSYAGGGSISGNLNINANSAVSINGSGFVLSTLGGLSVNTPGLAYLGVSVHTLGVGGVNVTAGSVTMPSAAGISGAGSLNIQPYSGASFNGPVNIAGTYGLQGVTIGTSLMSGTHADAISFTPFLSTIGGGGL